MRLHSSMAVVCLAALAPLAAPAGEGAGNETGKGLAPSKGLAEGKRLAEGKLVAKPDAFTTLINPQCSHCRDEAKRRAGELRDDERVLAWIRGYSQGGGIPLRFFLAPYRVISDTYGVFVYDAEAGYVRGFEPSLDFRFHGWRNGVMVMKHADGTLFSCLSGRAFDGPRKGQQLKPIATLETTWGHWLAAYPGAVAYHMFEKYQPVDLPRGDSADSISTRGDIDPRLPAGEMVLGVAIEHDAVAYPLAEAEKAKVITDTIGHRDAVVLWYAPTRTAAAYATEVEETTPPATVKLEADAGVATAPFVDRTTGSRFDIAGRAVSGPLAGKTLRWLPGIQCRWFAWAAEYPETEVHRAPAPQKPKEHAAAERNPPPLEAVLVEPEAVTPAGVSGWKTAGYRAVAVVLDERRDASVYRAAAAAASGSLDLYAWIEVGRNPEMAGRHPEWMASLGMHPDWRERFPGTTAPREGEVAKAFPWVPIACREAFDAHLARVRELVARAPEGCRGFLLNDLQGGPASCGCGNLLCRWAIDYHVPATAARLDGDDVAARFVAKVQEIAGARAVVPVWTTECEEVDLPAEKRGGAAGASLTGGAKQGDAGTGLCGTVPCAVGTCPKAFTRQWSALAASHRGEIGVLALHRELARERGAGGEAWMERALAYLDDVPGKNGGAAPERSRLWLTVQGDGADAAQLAALRERARRTGAHAVLVAMARVDQSYEPRIVAAK